MAEVAAMYRIAANPFLEAEVRDMRTMTLAAGFT